jgi:hypothetical protein
MPLVLALIFQNILSDWSAAQRAYLSLYGW